MDDPAIETYPEPTETITELEYRVKDDDLCSGGFAHLRYDIDVRYTPDGEGIDPVSLRDYMDETLAALEEDSFPQRTTTFLDAVYTGIQEALDDPPMLAVRLDPSLHHVDDEEEHGLYHVGALTRGDEEDETLFED